MDPGYARAYTHLGIAFSANGNRQRAVEYHHRAIELDPYMSPAHFNLAVDYVNLGMTAEAIDHLDTAIGLDPDYVKALHFLSQIHKNQGDIDIAIELEDRVEELESTARRRFLGRSAMPWATATPVAPTGQG